MALSLFIIGCDKEKDSGILSGNSYKILLEADETVTTDEIMNNEKYSEKALEDFYPQYAKTIFQAFDREKRGKLIHFKITTTEELDEIRRYVEETEFQNMELTEGVYLENMGTLSYRMYKKK